MKQFRWQILLGSSLIALSVILYLIHYAVFRDVRHIFLWSMTNLAFLPISVLVVTLIINRLLSARERLAKLEKLNMVIEVFFSEVGNRLLTVFLNSDANLNEIRGRLLVADSWTKQDFSRVGRLLKNYKCKIEIEKIVLEDLRGVLLRKTDFLLRLLENPNTLEHESFTELLRAVFHLKEELATRKDLKDLPATDYNHLAGDIRRAHILLVRQWLGYMRYLRFSYPYLFSLASRTNPFDRVS